ncbi:MAG: glycosyltransferase family 2 protein [Pseudoxanthomonas sp.]
MLSVVIPVFNEIDTLAQVLVAVSKALPGVAKEIIVVNDGSSDGTRDWIQAHIPDGCASSARLPLRERMASDCEQATYPANVTVRAFHHTHTLGKGASLKTGLAHVSGEVVVLQDADLEYDPQDWTSMYDLVAVHKTAQVVYGSRFLGRREGRAHFISWSQAGGNWLISALFRVLYRRGLSDVEVCYKMFTRQVSDTLNITCTDFGCEIQISAQIARSDWVIAEVAVGYRGRSRAEGKKIGWRDGFRALWYLVRFRAGSTLSHPQQPLSHQSLGQREVR